MAGTIWQWSQVIGRLLLNELAKVDQSFDDSHPLPRRHTLITATAQVRDHILRVELPRGTGTTGMKGSQFSKPNPGPIQSLLLGANFGELVHRLDSDGE